MLKIWGRDNSVNVQKVLWCCEELGLAHERVDAGGAHGVVNTPEYRRLNPNGLVPTLEEDSFVLWESNTIVRYLTARHSAGNLWPDDLRVRASADRWMDWQTTTFWPVFRPLFWNLIRTPADQRDPDAMERARVGTEEILRYLERHLETHQYLGGKHFSMGDIPMGCAIWRWMELPIVRGDHPNVVRWFQALSQRPAYRRSVMTPLS